MFSRDAPDFNAWLHLPSQLPRNAIEIYSEKNNHLNEYDSVNKSFYMKSQWLIND